MGVSWRTLTGDPPCASPLDPCLMSRRVLIITSVYENKPADATVRPVAGTGRKRRGRSMASLSAMPQDSRSWLEQAACRTEDPELFFPIANAGPALAQVAAAKAICGRCPVQELCLSYAMTTGQDSGIWGGLTETERRSLRLSQRRAG